MRAPRAAAAHGQPRRAAGRRAPAVRAAAAPPAPSSSKPELDIATSTFEKELVVMAGQPEYIGTPPRAAAAPTSAAAAPTSAAAAAAAR